MATNVTIKKWTTDNWKDNLTSNGTFRYIWIKNREQYLYIVTFENLKNDTDCYVTPLQVTRYLWM